MRTCIVIPTYWSAPGIETWKVFDHPTSLAEQGTLRRTLENIAAQDLAVQVVVFPAPTDPRIEKRAAELCQGLHVQVFTSDHLETTRIALRNAGMSDEHLECVRMNGYGGVRNMGLLYAAMNGFDCVIQIDDDELIEDPDYLTKALDGLGSNFFGKTGYYLDEAGRAYYDGQVEMPLPRWPKDEKFNEAVRENLETPERLHPTTIAFGGNMVINREMFLRVCYDPYGTRGEDDDYTINARHAGMEFFFDQALWVRHLPPKREGRHWTRHRQDIIRFKYLREKMRAYGMSPEELGVSNGFFVLDDLELNAMYSAVHAALRYEPDSEEHREFLANALLAVDLSSADLRERVEKSLSFQSAWRELLPEVEGCGFPTP